MILSALLKLYKQYKASPLISQALFLPIRFMLSLFISLISVRILSKFNCDKSARGYK